MKNFLLLKLIFFLLFSFSVGAQNLEQFLSIDRFAYYATDMASNLKKKGHHELAEALDSLRPEDLWAHVKNSPALLDKISDGHNYDLLLREIVATKNPHLAPQVDLILSNYNFFKNKLNESFKFKEILNMEARARLVNPTASATYKIPPIDDSALTLNAEQYISNRQTRAIIWDSIKNGRDIEFYMEDFQTALSSIESRGGKVTGEVQTLANNYNKNYLVFYPAENRYAHIITDISGSDRLYHLTKQLSIIKWNNVSGAERFSKEVPVFGPLTNILKHEKDRLVDLLEVLPKADHVVLGQKGAMERNIRLAQKVDAVLDHTLNHPQSLSLLEENERKLIKELRESQDLFSSMHQGSKWEGIFTKLESKLEELPDVFDFNIDLNSHAIADVNITSASGKIKRIRLISNVWGNEAKPIAEALIETGHKKFTYIGTAGALNDNYKLGDVVSPHSVKLQSGVNIDLPPPSMRPAGLKEGGNLVQVASLFDESEKWLINQRAKGADLVEMEVGYLAESFSRPGVKFNVFLLVSDVVGEEGETLDQASSSVRKKSQLNTLHEIFKSEKLTTVVPSSPITPGEVDNVILEMEPKRSAISIFQTKQKLKAEHGTKVPSKTAIKSALADNTPFTASLLQKRIDLVQDFLNEAHLLAKIEGKEFSLTIDSSLFDGTYHPKQKIKLGYLKNSKLKFEVLEKLVSSDSEFKKFIHFEVIQDAGGSVPVKDLEIPKLDLLRVYNENALAEGGLLGKISKAGNLSYAALPTKNHCKIFLKGAVP